VRQVVGTVRWRECVEAMAAHGVDRFVEVGAGKVLTGLVKRIAAGARSVAFGTPDDLLQVRPLLAS
jgi:[acyl-carrier-protein] S-malonyltransferase